MSPPASPMAMATRPSIPGRLVIERRTVMLYEALGKTAGHLDWELLVG